MFIIIYFTLIAIAVSLVNINNLAWKRVIILSILPPFLYVAYHMLLELLMFPFSNSNDVMSLGEALGFFFMVYLLLLPVFLLTSFGVVLVSKKFNLIPFNLAIFGAILGMVLLSLYLFTLKFWGIAFITGFWSVILCCMICQECKRNR